MSFLGRKVLKSWYHYAPRKSFKSQLKLKAKSKIQNSTIPNIKTWKCSSNPPVLCPQHPVQYPVHILCQVQYNTVQQYTQIYHQYYKVVYRGRQLSMQIFWQSPRIVLTWQLIWYPPVTLPSRARLATAGHVTPLHHPAPPISTPSPSQLRLWRGLAWGLMKLSFTRTSLTANLHQSHLVSVINVWFMYFVTPGWCISIPVPLCMIRSFITWIYMRNTLHFDLKPDLLSLCLNSLH